MGVAVDSAGNLFFSDTNNNRVRKVDTSGNISTVAGTGTDGFNGDGIAATSADLSFPTGIAIDPAGNLFIVDAGNERVRKVDTSGNISTVAGTGIGGFSGDGSAATSAQLAGPLGVAVDPAGNIFIADASNERVRKVDTSGNISTVAGTGTGGFNGDGIAATSARLNSPQGVAVDPAGNLVIADSFGHRIRRVVGVAAAASTADLSIAKSPHLVLRTVSSNLTYTLTVTNNGPDAASSVTVTDTLPGAVTFVSASAGCSESGGTVTCTAASLANGASVQFTITVTAPGTPGTVFSNTAGVVTAASFDPDTSDNSATAQITAVNPPGVPGLTTWSLGALAFGLGALVLVARRRRAVFPR